MERFYLEEHMKFLMDSLAEAYKGHSFKEFDRIKQQINQLRDVMNAKEIAIPNMLEG